MFKTGNAILRLKTQHQAVGIPFNGSNFTPKAMFLYDAPSKRLFCPAGATIRVYSTDTYDVMATITGFDNATCIRKDPLNSRFLVYEQGTQTFVPVDYTTLVKGSSIAGAGYCPPGFIFSNDGTKIITADNGSGMTFYNAADMTVLATVPAVGYNIKRFETNPLDDTLVWGIQDQANVLLINVNDFTVTIQPLSYGVASIQVDPNPSNAKIWTTGAIFAILNADTYGTVSSDTNAVAAYNLIAVDPVAANNRYFYLTGDKPYYAKFISK